MLRCWVTGICIIMNTTGAAFAAPFFVAETPVINNGIIQKIATCQSYGSCEQAVRNWCAGNHSRADGDDDGIPCENVCRSREQVRKIQQSIGCNR